MRGATAVSFLSNGGVMADLIASYDWSGSLGPIASWPQSLKTTVSFLIHSPVPIVLLWGSDGIMLYNDAYSGFAGGRHPRLLGSKVREGWPEVADFNDNVMKIGLAGGTLSYTDQELSLNRTGVPEPVWMNLDYSPVYDETGRPGGVIAVVVETTKRVLAERSIVAERERLMHMFRDAPSFMAQLDGPTHVFTMANSAYLQLVGNREILGKPIREALPDIAGQGFYELLDELYRTGESYSGTAANVRLQRTPDGPPEDRRLDFVYQPVKNASGEITGIFVEGYDVTEGHRAIEEIREGASRLGLALSASRLGMFSWDVTDGQVALDSRAQEILGLGTTKGAAQDVLRRVHPEDRDRLAADVKRASELTHGLKTQYRVRLDDGRTNLVETAGEILPGPDGKATRIVGVIEDVTAKRLGEQRLAALAELDGIIRDTDDPDALAQAASAVLGRALGVARAGYGVISARNETVTIERDWRLPGLASIAGTLQFRDYGSFIEDLKQGKTIVVADTFDDARTSATADKLMSIETRSFMNLPVMEAGEVVAVFYVNDSSVRNWSRLEIDFLREFSARTRTAIERRRAELALRANEARLRFLDELNTRTSATTDADHILKISTRMVGEHLNVSICAYADMDSDGDGFTIRGDWTAPGSPSIVGHYQLSDFGSLAVDSLNAGQPLVITDIAREIAPHEAATFQAIGIAATICMPLVKEGRLTALMAIHDRAPRKWSTYELALITEVTERSWAHIERVSAEAELKASESQLRLLAQTMPNHVWTARPDGQIDWVNEQVYIYCGARENELNGDHWLQIIHPEDRGAATERWAHALRTGEDYDIEFRIRRYDNVYRWHLARAVALRDKNDTIVRWIGSNTDVDDRKNAEGLLERRLEERTAELDRVWRVSQDMLGIADAHGVWVRLNPAWARTLGWSERELIGRSSEWLEHPDDIEKTRAEISRLAGGDSTLGFENRFRGKDGAYRTLQWSATAVDGMLYCTARDVTQQKEQEYALAATEEQLRQAQKMEAVGQLTGGIAHDFNNLLQGITGGIDRIQSRIEAGRYGDLDRFLKAVADSAHRAATLTHRLLAFSRRQTLDPRPLDVNKLIAGLEELIRRTVGPQIAVEVVGAGGLWPTRVDGPQLESALLNLCINARDAMPDGGHLTIETANRWLDERTARERELAPGQYVSLCVTDTGTGMTPDVIAKAFDPFFTTKPLGQGTGLGLSMIYGFVRQSGGQIRVYSEVSKGTTMCLYLPRHVGEIDEASIHDVEEIERGFGETVLVVDDEENVRMLVAEVLTEQHYRVVEAKDGRSAIGVLESDTRIDLMITDVGLPGGLNGRQVADRARELRSGLKVLFITGYAENAVISNHLEAGMAILAKPFAMSSLANKVREMIEGR